MTNDRIIFRDLPIGASFDWVGNTATAFASFFLRCTKTSKRTYRDENGTHHTVGTINARVFHVD